MMYYSTNNKNHLSSLKEAVLAGLAPDQGLYLPCEIPQLSREFIGQLGDLSFAEISIEIAKKFFCPEIPEGILTKLISDAINFPAPLIPISENIYTLELFHGPTCAFKDFGARVMARIMGYFVQNQNQPLTVLVATSGDTGSAVAAGFYDIPGISVIILYPKGKVSPIQEQQLTTWGKNIRAVEVSGTFDDCQKLVKMAFSDAELRARHLITSANSINIARLIPQAFYYAYGVAQLIALNRPIAISVPSGNFGNLTAGVIAMRMGIPIAHLIAATNQNDIVPQYLKTGRFIPRESIQTISNAMDVGNPSNFARLTELFGRELTAITGMISGYSFSDEQTLAAMLDLYRERGYRLDPHGAVGYLGLKSFLEEQGDPDTVGIFLETAHPAKFIEIIGKNPEVGEVELPAQLRKFVGREREIISIEGGYRELVGVIEGG